MHLPLIATYPETQGLINCADLIDPHAIILNATKVWPHNRASTMVVGKEVADMEVVAAGILPPGEATKVAEVIMMQEAAITPTVRVTHLTTGGTQEIILILCHTLSRMIPVTWSGALAFRYKI